MIYPSPKSPVNRQPMTVGWGRELISAVRSTMPVSSPGMLIRRGIYGTRYLPTAEAGTRTFTTREVKPFDVRWMSFADADGNVTGGEWQIYLPRGCATVSQDGVAMAYVPLNDKARNSEREVEGLGVYGWYALEEPLDADAEITTESGLVAKKWTVRVDLKPWPRMKATTMTEDEQFGRSQWSVAVASIYVADIGTGNDATTSRVAVRLRNEPLAYTWDTSATWALRYEMENAQRPDSGVRVYLTNQYKIIGRLVKEDIEPRLVTEWKSVWVKYLHPATEFTLDVDDDLKGGDAESDDDQTVFKIYDLDGGVVTADYRSAIPAMAFYNNRPDDPEDTQGGGGAQP